MPPAVAPAFTPEAWPPPQIVATPAIGPIDQDDTPLAQLSKWKWLNWVLQQGFRLGILTRWLPPTDAWVVCKRRPITELSPLKQAQIRQAYEDTDWSSDYSIEFVGIFTSRRRSLEAAAIPGGFFHHLPVDNELPDLPLQWGEHGFPAADTKMYERHQCEIMAVRRCEMEKVVRKAIEINVAANQAINST